MTKVLACTVSTENGTSPCGACRQVLAEFCDGEVPVTMVSTSTNEQIISKMNDLLPGKCQIVKDSDEK